MARAANTYSSTWVSTDQSAHTVSQQLRRYGSSTESADYSMKHWARRGTSSPPTGNEDQQTITANPPGTNWKNWTETDYACDTTYYWRCYAEFYNILGGLITTKSGIINSFLTYAADPTVGTPSLSGATSSTVTVDGSWTPATVETTVNILVQYKKTADSTWSEEAGDGSTGTGYTSRAITQVLVSGLDAETSYDFRLVCYRSGTSNTTQTYYGNTATTSTIADTPTVTTDPASASHGSATLNATVDHNTVDGALSWRYIDTASYSAPPDDAQGTEVAYGGNPITADGSGSVGISGLTSETGYTFWAIYDPTGAESTVFGAAATFTTSVSPLEKAAEEDHMITQYVDAVYGATQLITFALRSPSGTSSNDFYVGTAPVVATDSEVWLDGVSDGELDNAITQVADSSIAGVGNILYKFTLSAAQATASVTDIFIKDATATEAFRDHHIQVRTKQNLSVINVDASNMTNTTAVTYTGIGTGHGLSAVGGATGMDINGILGEHIQYKGTVATYTNTTTITLAATAPAVTSELVGSVILFNGGTGKGQARTITAYTSGRVATLNKAVTTALNGTTTYIVIPAYEVWKMSPGVELAALPTIASNYADMLQFNFQRFAYGRTQTATAFTMYEDDDATAFATAAVDDDQTTQTHNIMVDA